MLASRVAADANANTEMLVTGTEVRVLSQQGDYFSGCESRPVLQFTNGG